MLSAAGFAALAFSLSEESLEEESLRMSSIDQLLTRGSFSTAYAPISYSQLVLF